VRIEVEAHHIICGERYSTSRCPIALAVTSRLPAGRYAIVDQESVYVRERGRLPEEFEQAFLLPEVARKFVKKYDAQGPVWPFAFEMDDTGERRQS
jgi:hypothetical protein